VVVLTGPTAGGKSALALALAGRWPAEIINADSMQVYADLAVLTARPGVDDCARVPHRLYGVLPGRERCSAAHWRTLALAAIGACHAGGRLPLLVGGSGLYLRSLMRGIVELPDIPSEIRAAAQSRREALGPVGFHAEVATYDLESAARLPIGDRQRLLRAWEVAVATGKPLSAWLRETGSGPPCGLTFLTLVLLPARAALRAVIEQRLAGMIAAGALDEVARLLALALDPALPVMKAVGVPELAAHLRGQMSLAAAVGLAQRATGQYAKRQETWLRHQVINGASSDDAPVAVFSTGAAAEATAPELVRQFLGRVPGA